MRGRQALPNCRAVLPRTTPAHAGKTVAAVTASRRIRDHPRACGEDMMCRPCWRRLRGPPPRMRGRHHSCASPRPGSGTTPAHAGKTVGHMPAALSKRGHPRACGEDSFCACSASHAFGPPPRMRGRLLLRRQCEVTHGTTPAHAGKTIWRWRCRASYWDHPRACGEDTYREPELFGRGGPPPRMRGRPDHSLLVSLGQRTTPAHAGKTHLRLWGAHVSGDHPRACGEDDNPIQITPNEEGPPPRMRGRLVELRVRSSSLGTTPAHAGKTLNIAS